jgi:fatty-acyl-CoA synthase
MTNGDVSDTKRQGGGIRVAVLFGACVLFLASVALMIAAPFLFRWGVVDLVTAMGVLQKTALWTAVGAIGLGVIGLLLSFIGAKHRAGIVAVLVTAAAGMAAGGLYGRVMQREDLPPIHDVQTDWNLPVAFTEATLKEREKAGAVKVRDDATIGEGHGRWSGMSFAEAQAKFFDDVKPLVLPAALPDVTRAAAKAAERMGWQVTKADPDSGVVEAVYRSAWYELVYDIAIRVFPEDKGSSRVDVRSTSRTAGHDMGENAALVKQFLDELVMAL